jgi:hypothetical protein
MKYLAAAKEKNLDLADLPKTLQKKIKELEILKSEFENVKVSKDQLKPEELENYHLIEQKIAELDAYLEKRVRLFDPVKYNERIEINKVMAKRKQEKYSKVKEVEEEQEVSDEEEEPEVYQPRYEERPKQYLNELDEDVVPAVKDNEVQVPIKEQEASAEALAYVSKMVPVPEESKEVPKVPHTPKEEVPSLLEEVADEEEYEEEEFEKYGDAKPKKVINKGWWLMGAGFFLLTWGAVNVFKERRG